VRKAIQVLILGVLLVTQVWAQCPKCGGPTEALTGLCMNSSCSGVSPGPAPSISPAASPSGGRGHLKVTTIDYVTVKELPNYRRDVQYWKSVLRAQPGNPQALAWLKRAREVASARSVIEVRYPGDSQMQVWNEHRSEEVRAWYRRDSNWQWVGRRQHIFRTR